MKDMETKEILDLTDMFSSDSHNWDLYPEINLKAANLFPTQLRSLLISEKEIESGEDYKDPATSELLKLIFKGNGTDKWNVHDYYNIYSYIFEKLGRKSQKKLLEIGIGTNDPDICSTMGPDYKPGGSLRSYAQFLPFWKIYGADIDEKILFTEDRIKTSFVDQLRLETYSDMCRNLGERAFDVIIDDGLHNVSANLNTVIFALNSLNPKGYLIVEDISAKRLPAWQVIDSIVSRREGIETHIIRTKAAHIYLLHKK